MKTIIKWVIVFCVIILGLVLIFSAYANFFLDYSLQRLEVAMDATGKNFDTVSPLSRDIYSQVVKDLAVEEATKEKVDYKNVALLELASRSLDEAVEDSQLEKANFYLSQVIRSKLQDRPAVLQFIDTVFNFFVNQYRQVISFFDYLRVRLSGVMAAPNKADEYSSILLLNQAQEKLRDAKTDEAVDLYRKYLDLYPSQSERGFVSMALADVYIKQGKLEDAKKILQGVSRDFTGKEESMIADTILKRVEGMQRNAELIEQIRNQLPGARGTSQEEFLKLKLALAYLSSHQTEEARALFDELVKSEQPEIQRKAKFYQAWVYKLDAQFDQSATTFLDLLNDPEVEKDMQFLLQTQLADVYYQKGDVKKSLAEYQDVAQKASKETGISAEAFREIWLALAELEKAKIYKYDLTDGGSLADQSRRLGELDVKFAQAGRLSDIVQNTSNLALRERAFYELENGRVHIALDLFEKDLKRHVSDPWTHSGLAIVYILLGDAERSLELAQKGYGFGSDYYTASVLGYIHALLGHYDEAEKYYQEALGEKPDYMPAKFNLASLYLKMEKYQQGVGLLARVERDLGESQKLLRAKLLNNIGYAYWQLGDARQAQAKFKESLTVMPAFSMAKNNLSLIAAGETPRMVNLKE